jgi:rhodanese-related sulfurtransferase
MLKDLLDSLRDVFAPGGGVPTTSPLELQAWLKVKRRPLVLDVRTPREYATGHIAGAKLLPQEALREASAKLPRDRAIVCVCRSGRRSARACRELANLGFAEVSNLSGGMVAWRAADLPVRKNGV